MTSSTVLSPGGKIDFEDGTKAQLEITDFPRLEIGHRYVVYLEVLNSLKTHQPLGAPEGVFELKADGKVSPFATPQYTNAASNNDDVLEFVQRVRAAAKLQKTQH